VLIFTSFYLEPCIWPFAISRWIQQRNSIKSCANLGKSATETPAMIRQVIGEGSMNRGWKVQTHRDQKRRDRLRAKSRACSSFSLTLRGLFTKNSLRQAKQSTPRLGEEISGQMNWLLHHNNAPPHTSLFTRDFFNKINMTAAPHPYFSLFPD
jgi:hypothetical protein